MLTGTVGKPLPGVEVRIAEPDSSGVGEVIARGPNVMLGYYEDEASTRKTLVDRWLYTGDLGRVDDDGNLYLVGRSKEIIVDTNGKNVYPDELEETYADSPYVKELSIVGLPDGIGEKVACLVVADDEYDISLSRAALHRLVEEHFREVSASLPYYKRVKVLHFTDIELPRTATRKVKRREVVQIMESLEESQKSGRRGNAQESANADSMWLMGVVASVANRPRSEVSIDTRLSDLGFDSLMFVELATAIEDAGGSISAPERFNEVQDVRELLTVVARQPGASTKQEARVEDRNARTTKSTFLRSCERRETRPAISCSAFSTISFCEHITKDARTFHRTPISLSPRITASHLDMGLTKMALGEFGKDLVALAAADYFFDTKYKRAVMENFTNLVPMERTGSLRQSLRHAKSFLDRGYNALIFPEGTRSMTGTWPTSSPSSDIWRCTRAWVSCRCISMALTKRCPREQRSSRAAMSARASDAFLRLKNWKR